MRINPGRMIGIVMGLVILAAVFLVPFGSGGSTLYGTVSPMIKNLGTTQSSGSPATLDYDYTWIIAFILLVIAGLVGVFPFGAGVLGMVGMAMITVSPFLIYPNGPYTLSTGIGFYAAWVASVVSLVSSRWQAKKEIPSPAPATVAKNQGTATQTTQQTGKTKCPNCGTVNSGEVAKCSNCGKDLPAAK